MRDNCFLCPRKCGADRSISAGFCGVKTSADRLIAAKYMLHFGEEPPVSGTAGSGAVFFSGCNLRCVFCQNYRISALCEGKEISVRELADIFLKLQDKGAHNINLVTAAHFAPQVIKALDMSKSKLKIPVVYNSGGYESVDTIKMLDGYVDVYLPDIKYFSEELAMKYSNAPRYFETAFAAFREMLSQTGKYRLENGLIKKGVIVRHLILPNCFKDSLKIFEALADFKDEILVSLMRQYTPCGQARRFPEINRRLTTFEYEKVLDFVEKEGFSGFTQDKSAAGNEAIPDFTVFSD